MKRVIIFLFVVVFSFIGFSKPLITGAFIQLDSILNNYSEEDWEREIGYMKDIGIDTIVVQYSRYGDNFYYPSKYSKDEELPDESLLDLSVDVNENSRYLKIQIPCTSREWTLITEIEIISNSSNIAPDSIYEFNVEPSKKYPDDGKIVDEKSQYSWNSMVGWDYPGKMIEINFDLNESVFIDKVIITFLKSDISGVELPEDGYNVLLKTDGDYSEPLNASWNEFENESEKDPLKNILEVSEKNSMDVFMGLGLNPDYWSGSFDVDKELSENKKVLTELFSLYKNFNSLKGWYLPEELEDRSFNTEDKKNDVIKYLKGIKTYSKFLTKKPIMISPYFGMNPNGLKYGEWWEDILKEVNIDIIAMQDGVGTHRTNVEESTKVFEDLQPVMEKYGVEFWANNEVFDQIHGWPVDLGSWKSEPANIERVLDQLNSMNPYVKKLIIFDFPHYMSPTDGGKAEELYNDYLYYFNEQEE